MNTYVKEVVVMLIPITLMCLITLCFWVPWKRYCIRQHTKIKMLILALIPLLSPIMFGVTWWNFPRKDASYHIVAVVFPLIVTAAMFSYSVYNFKKGCYQLLSLLAFLISGLALFLECCAATYLIFALFGK